MKKILFIVLFLCTPAFAAAVDPLNQNDPNFGSSLNDDIQKINYQVIGINHSYPVSKLTGQLDTAHGGTGQDFSNVAAESIPYFSAIGVMGNIGIGTTGYVLTSNGPATPPSFQFPLLSSIVGDELVSADYRMTSEDSNSFVKHFEKYINRPGDLRIKFWLMNASGTAHGQIYRNGVAVGTDQSGDGQYSQDITGWTKSDLLQLYCKDFNGGNTIECGGLEIYEGNPIYPGLSPSNHLFLYSGTSFAGNASRASFGNIGDLLSDSAGGVSTTLYVKTGAATWTAK